MSISNRNGEYLIGHCGVDSGQILAIDPCYIKNNFDVDFVTDGSSPYPSDELNYHNVCERTVDGNLAGEIGGGVAFSTGWGDGCYPVYAEYRDGRIMAIRIEFDGRREMCEDCGYHEEDCVCGCEEDEECEEDE